MVLSVFGIALMVRNPLLPPIPVLLAIAIAVVVILAGVSVVLIVRSARRGK